VKVPRDLDLTNIALVKRRLSEIIIYEVKSTRKPLKADFGSFFFALSAAELLVAQGLKEQFRFAFVNTVTGAHMDLTLREVFARARGIYATWSISF
jgi:hypothetical protein